MSEQMVRKTADRVRVRMMVQIAVLGAAATVLMALEFPVPFLAPPFYKLDFSEIPVLVGAFALGPAAGAAIELLKVLLHMLLQGTQTAGVGDLANFLIGCSYVIPAAMIYRSKKTRRRAVAGLAAGSVCMVFAGCVMNAFVLEMGAAIHPAINSLFRFCLLAVGPFNLLKGIADAAVTLLIYKRIRGLLKGEV